MGIIRFGGEICKAQNFWKKTGRVWIFAQHGAIITMYVKTFPFDSRGRNQKNMEKQNEKLTLGRNYVNYDQN